MCYDIRYLTKKQEDYARRFGKPQRDLSALDVKLEHIQLSGSGAVYHTNGFDHEDIPVITGDHPNKVQFFSWGLIPHWVRESQQAIQISNRTLNAKGETLREKPAFRDAVDTHRCMILVDGFFEHHHKHGKTFPHHITWHNDTPFGLAGLWSLWRDPRAGIARLTVSIVTTRANSLLAGIHNNPKLPEPRMPVILTTASEELWLSTDPLPEDAMDVVLKPIEADHLKAFPVRRLRGKEYIGNRPEIVQPFSYPELTSLFDT